MNRRTSNLEPRTSNARRVSGVRGTFSEFDVRCSTFDVFPSWFMAPMRVQRCTSRLSMNRRGWSAALMDGAAARGQAAAGPSLRPAFRLRHFGSWSQCAPRMASGLRMNPPALWAAASHENSGYWYTTTCYYFRGNLFGVPALAGPVHLLALSLL